MSDETSDTEEETPKKSSLGLFLVIVFGLLAGGGGFAAVWFGLLDSVLSSSEPEIADMPETDDPMVAEATPSNGPSVRDSEAAFYTLDPFAVSIGVGADSRELRIQVVLDTSPQEIEMLTLLAPRLTNGFLGYLRAIDTQTLDNPAALIHIRAQLLRRARLIAGDSAIRNVLVTDFVLN